MLFKRFAPLLLTIPILICVHNGTAQTVTENKTGNQGGYTYEYWKDQGTGTMTLGEGGNFSCSWSNIGNILFRKSLRPGVKNQTITYSATYNPSGNSYLCVYGWTKNPLVEYYVVESWGSWRPPGGQPKGTVTCDNGTYDIYQTTRTNQPSIEGTKTFQQYWSVRQSKRTSGTVACINHFNAWESKGMPMGSMYEVSFTVEGYQSSGNADVTMKMGTGSGTGVNGNPNSVSFAPASLRSQARDNYNRFNIVSGSTQSLTFTNPVARYFSVKLFNARGQAILSLPGQVYAAGWHAVPLSTLHIPSGAYFYAMQEEN